MADFPVKPSTPVFRSSAPGAANCKICLPIAHCERGHTYLRNLAPSPSIVTCPFQDANVGWANDWYGPSVGVTGASDGVRIGALSDALVNPAETTFVLIWSMTSTTGTNKYVFSENKNEAVCQVQQYDWGAPYFYYGTSSDYVYAFLGAGQGLTVCSLNILTAGPRGVEFWADGGFGDSDVTGFTVPDVSGAYYMNLFSARGSASSPLAKISYFARYDRQLTIPEIADIYSDPWGMIRPKKLFVDYGYVAGGAPPADTVGTLVDGGLVGAGLTGGRLIE